MRKSIVFIFSIFLMTILFSANLPASQRGIHVKVRTQSGSSKEIQLYSGYHALVIGCGDYRDPLIPDLSEATKDAGEVSVMLKGLGFEVKALLNPNSRKMQDAFNSLIANVGRQKDKAILVYFAGHGETLKQADGTKLGYILPVDTPHPEKDYTGFLSKAISMKKIDEVSRLIQSKHVLMLFDSCFSGALFGAARDIPKYITEKTTMPVREYITAGTENETVPDKSIFKSVFLQGISKHYADINSDGYITGLELGMYLSDKVVQYSNGGQHPQVGKINHPALDKGDFVFIASGKAVVDKPTYPPGKFKIWLKIKDWHIYSHRILDYKPSWGHLRLLGRYDYLGTLVNKIKSDEFPDYYWLVRIPTEKEGEYEIIAERQREPSFDLKPIEAPKQFSICLQIVNNKVKNHFIQNPHTGWGTFYVDKYRQGILYIRNDFFPGEIWRVKMPKKDGKWTIYAKLSKY